MNLSKVIEFREAIATTGAGTSEITGGTIDMQNFEGCLFVVKFGTAASNNQLQAQQDSASGMGTVQDLKNTLTTVGSSDEIVYLDIYRPTKRFIRIQAERGTSTTIDWGIAIKYGPRKFPVDNDVSGTIAGEVHISPVEGTV